MAGVGLPQHGVDGTRLELQSLRGTRRDDSRCSAATLARVSLRLQGNAVSGEMLMEEVDDAGVEGEDMWGGMATTTTAAPGGRYEEAARRVGRVLAREDERKWEETSSHAYYAFLAFVCGWVCILPWCAGFLFLRSRNPTARILALISVFLLTFVVGTALVLLILSLLHLYNPFHSYSKGDRVFFFHEGGGGRGGRCRGGGGSGIVGTGMSGISETAARMVNVGGVGGTTGV